MSDNRLPQYSNVLIDDGFKLKSRINPNFLTFSKVYNFCSCSVTLAHLRNGETIKQFMTIGSKNACSEIKDRLDVVDMELNE